MICLLYISHVEYIKYTLQSLIILSQTVKEESRVYEMSTTCTECDMEFWSKDAMLKQYKNKHQNKKYPQSNDAYQPPPPPPPPQT